MANLTPTPGNDNVPRLETTTIALAGPGGPMNAQAQALLNRQEQMKADIAEFNAQPDPFPQYTTDEEVQVLIAASADESVAYFLAQI